MFSRKFHGLVLLLLLGGMLLPGCAIMDEWIAPTEVILPGPDGVGGTPDDVVTPGPSKLTTTLATGQLPATAFGFGHYAMMVQGLSVLLTQAYGVASSVRRKEEEPDGEAA